LTLVLYYRPANTYSLNAVAGALETVLHLARREVVCADDFPLSRSWSRILGSNRGRFSFPIHVNSSFCFPVMAT
jgi:hypothetical protein